MRQITAVHMVGGVRHEHIAELQWVSTEGAGTFRTSRADMVVWLRQPGNQAFVQAGGTRVGVRVVNANPPYVQTYADGTPTDNLLRLPRY
jgi:hypothetical protein